MGHVVPSCWNQVLSKSTFFNFSISVTSLTSKGAQTHGSTRLKPYKNINFSWIMPVFFSEKMIFLKKKKLSFSSCFNGKIRKLMMFTVREWKQFYLNETPNPILNLPGCGLTLSQLLRKSWNRQISPKMRLWTLLNPMRNRKLTYHDILYYKRPKNHFKNMSAKKLYHWRLFIYGLMQ